MENEIDQRKQEESIFITSAGLAVTEHDCSLVLNRELIAVLSDADAMTHGRNKLTCKDREAYIRRSDCSENSESRV
ncbi:MAG: hypothetical protein IKD69_00920 [Solobacterium sp.]|nr:hypothetical protein [Solobacterium sp.]